MDASKIVDDDQLDCGDYHKYWRKREEHKRPSQCDKWVNVGLDGIEPGAWKMALRTDRGKIYPQDDMVEALGCDWEAVCNVCIHEGRRTRSRNGRETDWMPEAVILVHVTYFENKDAEEFFITRNPYGEDGVLDCYDGWRCKTVEPFAILVLAPSSQSISDETIASFPVWWSEEPPEPENQSSEERSLRQRKDVMCLAIATTPRKAQALHYLPMSGARDHNRARITPARFTEADPGPLPDGVDPDFYTEVHINPNQWGTKALQQLNGEVIFTGEIPVRAQLKQVQNTRRVDPHRRVMRHCAEMTVCSLIEQGVPCGITYWKEGDMDWPKASQPFDQMESLQHQEWCRTKEEPLQVNHNFVIRMFDPKVLFDPTFVPYLAHTPWGTMWYRRLACCTHRASDEPYRQPAKYTKCLRCGAYLNFFAGDWGVIQLVAFGIMLHCPKLASAWAGDIHQSIFEADELYWAEKMEPTPTDDRGEKIPPKPCCEVEIYSTLPPETTIIEAIEVLNNVSGPKRTKKPGKPTEIRQTWSRGMKNMNHIRTDAIACYNDKKMPTFAEGEDTRDDPVEKAKNGVCPVHLRPGAYAAWHKVDRTNSHRNADGGDGCVVELYDYPGTTPYVGFPLIQLEFELEADIPIWKQVRKLFRINGHGMEWDKQFTEFEYAMSVLVQTDFHLYSKGKGPEYLKHFGKEKDQMKKEEREEVSLQVWDHICQSLFLCPATTFELPPEAKKHGLMLGIRPRGIDANQVQNVQQRMEARLICMIRGHSKKEETLKQETLARKAIRERTHSRIGSGLPPQRKLSFVSRGMIYAGVAGTATGQRMNEFTVGNEFIAVTFTVTLQAWTPLLQALLIFTSVLLLVAGGVATCRYINRKTTTTLDNHAQTDQEAVPMETIDGESGVNTANPNDVFEAPPGLTHPSTKQSFAGKKGKVTYDKYGGRHIVHSTTAVHRCTNTAMPRNWNPQTNHPRQELGTRGCRRRNYGQSSASSLANQQPASDGGEYSVESLRRLAGYITPSMSSSRTSSPKTPTRADEGDPVRYPLTDAEKAKIKCIFYQHDKGCRNGDKCKFAHSKVKNKAEWEAIYQPWMGNTLSSGKRNRRDLHGLPLQHVSGMSLPRSPSDSDDSHGFHRRQPEQTVRDQLERLADPSPAPALDDAAGIDTSSVPEIVGTQRVGPGPRLIPNGFGSPNPGCVREYGFIMHWLDAEQIKQIMTRNCMSTGGGQAKHQLAAALVANNGFPKMSQLNGIVDIAKKLIQQKQISQNGNGYETEFPEETLRDMVFQSCFSRRICHHNIMKWHQDFKTLCILNGRGDGIRTPTEYE